MNNLNKQIFIDRLKDAVAKAGITTRHGMYAEVARRCGVTLQAAKDWFDVDKGFPRPEFLAKLAQALNISIEFLLLGTGYQNISLAVPILATKEAIHFSEFNDYSQMKSIAVLPSYQVSYAIVMENESMINPLNLCESFPPNLLLFFNKINEKDVFNGDLVFAKLSEDEGIFAKFIHENGKSYLMTLNPNYANHTDNFKIIGKMVYFLGGITFKK